MGEHEFKVLTDAQKRLRADVDALAATLAEHGGSLDALEQAVVDAATSPGRSTHAGGAGDTITGYSARASSPEDHAQAVKDLTAWLGWANPTLIVPRSSSRAGIPPCWARHPGAVEELLALHGAWQSAYADGPNDAMIGWHDRWLDSSVSRVLRTYTLQECDRDDRCQLDRPPVVTPPTTDPPDPTATPVPATAFAAR